MLPLSVVGDGCVVAAAIAAARRRFHRASTLVNALSSTGSWYSSGPITP